MDQPVLPEFLTVVDDPTQRKLNGMDLGGWYEYDDEGMAAAKVEVIKNGILKDFLMSRMPIKNFDKSNGHGRAQPGFMPTGRQGNLIVSSSHTVKDTELRQKLIDEAKKQGKPYGLYFEDIQGGFTLTQRSMPQAFQVLPVLVWRVYTDGRADELRTRHRHCRHSSVGTRQPHSAHGAKKSKSSMEYAARESGQVPVAAAAPAMLFSEIEVQKRAHSLNRPPILPAPSADDASSKKDVGDAKSD